MTEFTTENGYLIAAQKQFENGELSFDQFREIRRAIISGLEAGQRIPESSDDSSEQMDVADEEDYIEEEYIEEDVLFDRKPSSLDRIDTSLLTNAILFAAGVAFIMLLYVLFM